MTDQVAKSTPDLVAEQIARLKTLFPECVTESQVDFDRLRATLGDLDALAGQDTYSFTWAGKQEAFRAIQSPSAASLAPVPEESVHWDTTQHLFIEGENLEVLKLLYKSYFGQVKMIYIDPPYNTGNDFIYQDDYRQPLRAYLEKTGQIDAEGNVLRTNTGASGRYHSDWLSMMYPRLFLSRQLLREDGVIFVSIDDNEMYHLRVLMNEVFGEENFVATVIWQKVFSPKNTAKYFSEDHDYVVIYARNKEIWRPNLLPRSEEANERYQNPDDDPRGPWASSDLTARNYYSEGQYEVTAPNGNTFRPSIGTYWRVSSSKFNDLDKDDRIWWGEDGGNMPRLKRFLSDVQQGIVPQTLWEYSDVGHTQEAKKELLAYVPFEHTENVLNSVKPRRLIQRMLQIATNPRDRDLVFDFFSGSAATAHAVLEQNRQDGGNRRFIMVQIAEPLPIPESRLKTIADIGTERIRNVIKQTQQDSEDNPDQPSGQDPGFKAFKLRPSTFHQWLAPAEDDPDALHDQLSLFDRGLVPGADPQHVIYEVLLKEGFRLNARIESLDLAHNAVYRVADEDSDRFFYITLDEAIAPQTLDALALDRETIFICLDAALDDSQKVNLAMQCLLKTI